MEWNSPNLICKKLLKIMLIEFWLCSLNRDAVVLFFAMNIIANKLSRNVPNVIFEVINFKENSILYLNT